MKGFSVRNLKYMRAFAREYPEFVQAPLAQIGNGGGIVQAPLAQLPWYHHIALLDRVKDRTTRLFYVTKAVEFGWSRNVMIHQIESGLHHRQGKAITNFDHTLPPLQSDLAKEALKNPYIFDFLSLGENIQEKDFEKP